MDKRKVLLLSSALFVLALAGFTVLFWPATRLTPAEQHVAGMVQAFNDGNIGVVADACASTVRVAVNEREGDTQTREQVLRRLKLLKQRFVYMRVRPESYESHPAAPGSDGAIQVTMPFQWTVASSVFPGRRVRSENQNPGGEPELVRLTLIRTEDEWQVVAIDLQLSS